jgi:hypothetical protein
VAAALLVAAAPNKAEAGNKDCDTAAAIVAGVAAVGLLAVIASQSNSRVAVDYRVGSYMPPPPPPPVQEWVPGHYEISRERVCIPGYWTTVTEPAEYGWVRQGCRRVWVMIKPPCTRKVWVPERYEWQETRVWVPGHYMTANGYACR